MLPWKNLDTFSPPQTTVVEMLHVIILALAKNQCINHMSRICVAILSKTSYNAYMIVFNILTLQHNL